MWKLVYRVKSEIFRDNKKSVYMFKFKAITFGLLQINIKNKY
jgi:hypothetical protein